MSRALPLARAFLCAVLAAAGVVTPLHAQRSLDVPFVPTNQPTVEAMLRIANVGPNDFVFDLGWGDGRILIAAARLHGARGFGVDLDPQRVKESTENARAAGARDKQSFEIEFKQKYQEIEAVARGLERPVIVRDARIEGERIAFTLVDDGDFTHRLRFEGRVSGNTIEGVARGDGAAPRGEQKWRAIRTPS